MTLCRSSGPYPVPLPKMNDIPGMKVPGISISCGENSPGRGPNKSISMSPVSGLSSIFLMNTHGDFLLFFLTMAFSECSVFPCGISCCSELSGCDESRVVIILYRGYNRAQKEARIVSNKP